MPSASRSEAMRSSCISSIREVFLLQSASISDSRSRRARRWAASDCFAGDLNFANRRSNAAKSSSSAANTNAGYPSGNSSRCAQKDVADHRAGRVERRCRQGSSGAPGVRRWIVALVVGYDRGVGHATHHVNLAASQTRCCGKFHCHRHCRPARPRVVNKIFLGAGESS